MQSGRKPPNLAARQLYAKYHYEARRRNMYWGLTLEGFLELTSKPCHYCGRKFSNRIEHHGRTHAYNGLDRKNNKRGYELTNVLPCCVKCNAIKGQYLSYEEMRAAMRAILKLRK